MTEGRMLVIARKVRKGEDPEVTPEEIRDLVLIADDAVGILGACSCAVCEAGLLNEGSPIRCGHNVAICHGPTVAPDVRITLCEDHTPPGDLRQHGKPGDAGGWVEPTNDPCDVCGA